MPRLGRLPRRTLLAALAAGCAPQRPSPHAVGPASAPLFVVQRGWHTDIGLLAEDLAGPLAPLAAAWPGATSLLVGFGERAYLMGNGLALAELALALLPGPGALLVTGLSVPPDAAFPTTTVMQRVAAPGMSALRHALSASFERAADGSPLWLREGPYPGAAYYAAVPRYSAGFTCNTWTAALLRVAGLPVRVDGVVFAGQVMAQLRAMPGA